MKEEIQKFLLDRRFDRLGELQISKKRLISKLISLAYDKQTLICWRAIEAIGYLTKEVAETKPEIVRDIVGRLLWMIREESGGIGWSSPEILGEIVRNSPDKFSDIAPIILSFIDEEMLAPGVIWAIGRIGEVRPDLVNHAVPVITSYLNHSDAKLRGLTAWALGELQAGDVIHQLRALLNDTHRITLYKNGELTEKTLDAIAEKAINRISKQK